MAFVSLSTMAAKTGRMVQSNHVTVTQTKRATGAVELGFRIGRTAMDATGIETGDRVDILYDSESSLWMIKKSRRVVLELQDKRIKQVSIHPVQSESHYGRGFLVCLMMMMHRLSSFHRIQTLRWRKDKLSSSWVMSRKTAKGKGEDQI